MDNALLDRRKELPKKLGVFLIYCLSLALFSYGVMRVVFTLLTMDSGRPPDYLSYTIATGRSRSTALGTSADQGDADAGAAVDLDITALRNPFAIPMRLSAASDSSAEVPAPPSFPRGEQQPAGAAQVRQLESFSRDIRNTAVFPSLRPVDPFVGHQSYPRGVAQLMTTSTSGSSRVDETTLADTHALSSSEAVDPTVGKQALDPGGAQHNEAAGDSRSALIGSGPRRPVVDMAMPCAAGVASHPLSDVSSAQELASASADSEPPRMNSETAPAAVSPAIAASRGSWSAPAQSETAPGATVAPSAAVARRATAALSAAAASGAAGSAATAVSAAAVAPEGEPLAGESEAIAPTLFAVTRLAGVAEPLSANQGRPSAADSGTAATPPDSSDSSPSRSLDGLGGVAPRQESTSVSAEEISAGSPDDVLIDTAAVQEHDAEESIQNMSSVAVAKPKVPVVADTPETELLESIVADEPAKVEWPPITVTGVIVTGEGLSSAAVRVSGKPQVVRQGDRVRIEDRLDELEVLSIRRDLIELRLGGEVRQYRIGDGPVE